MWPLFLQGEGKARPEAQGRRLTGANEQATNTAPSSSRDLTVGSGLALAGCLGAYERAGGGLELTDWAATTVDDGWWLVAAKRRSPLETPLRHHYGTTAKASFLSSTSSSLLPAAFRMVPGDVRSEQAAQLRGLRSRLKKKRALHERA